MDSTLKQINKEVYEKIDLRISKFQIEPESKEYAACRFELNGRVALCRNAKITPKKVGQFVTFWKRSAKGPIEPFNESDEVDFYLVNVRNENRLGQFVFPKAVLIQRGIISTETREGKRGFRVYPTWDIAKSDQAKRTQKWQLEYFYEIAKVDLGKVQSLYLAE